MFLYIGFVVPYSVLKPFLALHNYEFFKLQKLLGRGGKTMFARPPPQYFHGGSAPPPPRIDASPLTHLSDMTENGKFAANYSDWTSLRSYEDFHTFQIQIQVQIPMKSNLKVKDRLMFLFVAW